MIYFGKRTKMARAIPSGGQLVGREAELAALGDLLRPGRRQCAVALVGEAGIGKTSVLRTALEAASDLSLHLLIARPAAGEQELPFSGLADLLGGVPTHVLDRVADSRRSALEAALARKTSRDDGVDAHLVARGVLDVLRLEAAEGDLLVVVDDLQWLDRPTVVVLTFALRRVGDTPLRVLVAARAGGPEPSELPLGLGEWQDARQVEVGPLSATELGLMLRERLSLQMSRPRLEQLRAASGGNPLFALELARAPAPGRKGSNLLDALADRLRGFAVREQTALSVASAALLPTPELLFSAGVDREALSEVLASDVIELDGERLRFSHPLLATAAYELLPPDERRAVHIRLAEVTDDVIERGHHIARSASTPDEAAAAALFAAAEEAAKLGDHAGAAAFLQSASAFTSDDAGKVEWELRAAAELELAGDVQAARAIARELVNRLPAGVERARARQTLVACGIEGERSYGAAVAELEHAVKDASADAALQAELHEVASVVSLTMFRVADAVAHARAAFELAESAGASATSVVALACLGFAESLRDGGVPDSSRKAYAEWDGTPDLVYGSPRMVLACVCLGATRFEEAQELFEAEMVFAQEQGWEPVEVIARGHLAETQLRAGRWAEAHANARGALEHAREAAGGQVVVAASAILALTEAMLGRHSEARMLVEASLPEAEAVSDFWWTIGHRAVLGFVALTDGDAPEAIEALQPAWSLMTDYELGDLSLFPVAQVLAEALVGAKRLEDACGIAARLRTCPVGDGPWCRAMADRCEALVASARGEHDAARHAMASALAAHVDLPEPFEHARALHVAGRVEHRARNWGASRRFLVEALDRFDELGAARWAEKAAADLTRLPGRRPADPDALTVREREVAELVAAGLTNKEVAGKLFVSTRTVEANLSKVYAKLGVRSRTELAGRLARPS